MRDIVLIDKNKLITKTYDILLDKSYLKLNYFINSDKSWDFFKE